MDQELLMKQIVEQVMAAMKNGTPASAPAAASSCGSMATSPMTGAASFRRTSDSSLSSSPAFSKALVRE